MPRLANRQKQIPNGLKFYQPETKWSPRPFASFQGIVESLIAHRKANPYLTTLHGWSVDPVVVADEVDAFNAAICERMGWTDYLGTGQSAGGGQPVAAPFTGPVQTRGQTLLRRAANVAVGVETLVEWISSGSEAVPSELSEKRAAVCVNCPQNERGDLLRWFTKRAATAIKAAVESRKAMNLSTTQDEKLGMCNACGCELHLKVHLPLSRIKSRMTKEVSDALDANCWIRNES